MEKGRRDRARQLLPFVLGGLVVAFALLNLDEVEVQWLVGTWETPLILVIAICFLLGAFAGWLVTRRRSG